MKIDKHIIESIIRFPPKTALRSLETSGSKVEHLLLSKKSSLACSNAFRGGMRVKPYRICGIKKPFEGLFGLEDLIRSDELKGLKEWDDYILLKHRSDNIYKIKKEGLKCCTDINPELAKVKISYCDFGNDPDLIYFRPITPHGPYSKDNDSVIVAIRKNKAKLFNQEERVTSDFGLYNYTSMPIEKYDDLLSQKKPGQIINRYGRLVPCPPNDNVLYIPEVCFKDRYIPPEYFVK